MTFTHTLSEQKTIKISVFATSTQSTPKDFACVRYILNMLSPFLLLKVHCSQHMSGWYFLTSVMCFKRTSLLETPCPLNMLMSLFKSAQPKSHPTHSMVFFVIKVNLPHCLPYVRLRALRRNMLSRMCF